LRRPFHPTARRQNFPNKWNTTLCDNFAATIVSFPWPLPTFDFVFPHIAIAFDDSPQAPKKGKESKGCHLPPHQILTQNHEVNLSLSAGPLPT
jgi:hypothetical protein